MKKLLAVLALAAIMMSGPAVAATATVGESSTTFNPYMILWIVSVLAMFGAVWLMRKRRERLAAAAAGLTAIFTMFVFFGFLAVSNDAYVIAAAFSTFTALAATGAAIAANAAASAGDKKMFYIFAGIYGILMAVIMVAFLLS